MYKCEYELPSCSSFCSAEDVDGHKELRAWIAVVSRINTQGHSTGYRETSTLICKYDRTQSTPIEAFMINEILCNCGNLAIAVDSHKSVIDLGNGPVKGNTKLMH